MRGTLEDVPSLPVLEVPAEEPEEPVDRVKREPEAEPEKRSDLASGPKVEDPYDTMEQSQMFLPILVALACFFPLLYCLCKI